ncbi:MAG: OmpA family protein [Betaproteobacteria bacterium]|nr:OmpA family protein [Betaproteobacteria bacterium]
MNKQVKLAVAAAAVVIAMSPASYAQKADPSKGSGYVVGAEQNVVKNGFGQCWRTGYFTPAMAIAGCDDDLLPKPAPAPAPRVAPPPPPPPPPPAPKPPAPPPPAPTSEKVTFAAEALFDFDKSVVKPEGRARLDDLVGKIKGITLEVVIAVGHTDAIGTDAYNQRLSVRRAEAVKAYLVSKGIPANRIYTEGKGKKQPVADNRTAAGRAKNRRVEVEVVGTRRRG